jgi:hypothetical protein
MNYILSACDRNYLIFAYEFVVSLFILGNFDGRFVLFYYKDENENEEEIRDIFTEFNVDFNFISKESTEMTNVLFLDCYSFIESLSVDDKVAIYDIDVWFQDDVNDLFNMEDGIVYCSYESKQTERNPSRRSYFEKYINLYFKNLSNNIEDIINNLNSQDGDILNSGLIAGTSETIKKYLQRIYKYYDEEPNLINHFGPDQVVLNLDYNKDYYNPNLREYNCCSVAYSIMFDVEIRDGFLYVDGKKVKAFHMQVIKNCEKFCFRYWFKDVFNSHYIKLGDKSKDILQESIKHSKQYANIKINEKFETTILNKLLSNQMHT